MAQTTTPPANVLRDSLHKAADALAYYPDSIDLRLRKARWNMELREWQNAKNEYDIVLNREPTNVAALYYRAYCNDRLGRYNFARLDYQNMLTIVPGNLEARLGLALLNEKDHHYTEALDGINQLVAAHPDSAVAWAARAGIEQERGMNELAEYDYGEALKRDPNNKDYLLTRADLRIKLGNYAEARRDLDLLVTLGTPKAALKEWYGKLK
jgi:tetratricopeptide (TPR) repeat protein